MLALVGDHDPSITAHRAIPLALARANRALGSDLKWTWLRSDEVGNPARTLHDATGLWVVPGSPYASMDGALAAIRFARERALPFLGTCGGFQHALIEFARHIAGIAAADHAETAGVQRHLIGDTGAEAPDLVITPLACSLVEKTGPLAFLPGSQLHGIFGGRVVREGYHCNYGVNPVFRARLEAAGLRFTGFDPSGDIRAFELPSHPFFIGTLFQPERSALRDEDHPLVQAFLRGPRSSSALPCLGLNTFPATGRPRDAIGSDLGHLHPSHPSKSVTSVSKKSSPHAASSAFAAPTASRVIR